MLVVGFCLDFCKVCYCLRALRQLDCPNGVEALEGFVNRQYGRVDLGGAAADCSALQRNFPMASIVDCMQIGGGGGGATVEGSGSGSGGSGFNADNLWALLTLLLFFVPIIWRMVKQWRARRAAAAAVAEGLPAVAYQVEEPEDGSGEAEGVPAGQVQQQQLAIEPASTITPLEPQVVYDLMG